MDFSCYIDKLAAFTFSATCLTAILIQFYS